MRGIDPGYPGMIVPPMQTSKAEVRTPPSKSELLGEWWEHDGHSGKSHYYHFAPETQLATSYYEDGRLLHKHSWWSRFDLQNHSTEKFHRIPGPPDVVRAQAYRWWKNKISDVVFRVDKNEQVMQFSLWRNSSWSVLPLLDKVFEHDKSLSPAEAVKTLCERGQDPFAEIEVTP
jgi:hypothetical protein